MAPFLRQEFIRIRLNKEADREAIVLGQFSLSCRANRNVQFFAYQRCLKCPFAKSVKVFGSYFSSKNGFAYPQYLNCKILHGGRFCSLDQLYKKFSGNDVFPSPKLNEDQKQEKGFRLKLKSFFPEIR